MMMLVAAGLCAPVLHIIRIMANTATYAHSHVLQVALRSIQSFSNVWTPNLFVYSTHRTGPAFLAQAQ